MFYSRVWFSTHILTFFPFLYLALFWHSELLGPLKSYLLPVPYLLWPSLPIPPSAHLFNISTQGPLSILHALPEPIISNHRLQKPFPAWSLSHALWAYSSGYSMGCPIATQSRHICGPAVTPVFLPSPLVAPHANQTHTGELWEISLTFPLCHFLLHFENVSSQISPSSLSLSFCYTWALYLISGPAWTVARKF